MSFPARNRSWRDCRARFWISRVQLLPGRVNYRLVPIGQDPGLLTCSPLTIDDRRGRPITSVDVFTERQAAGKLVLQNILT